MRALISCIRENLWVVFLSTLGVSLIFLQLGIFYSFVAAFIVYTLCGGYAFFRIVFLTLLRDARAYIILQRLSFWLRWMNYKGYLIIDLFRWTAERYPNKIAFQYDDQNWSFKQLDEFSNSVANALMQQGYKKGDVIAVFMESRPAYVGIWLGMAKVGVVPALLNYNLRHSCLMHCLQDAKCRAMIFGTELAAAVHEVLPDLTKWQREMNLARDTEAALARDTQLQLLGTTGKTRSNTSPDNNNTTAFALFSADFGSPERSSVVVEGSEDFARFLTNSTSPEYYLHSQTRGRTSVRDPLLFIYTSGTTGMPKAAIVNQGRFYTMAFGVCLLLRIRHTDVIYNSLPLYHTAGGMIGVGQSLLCGTTVVIRRKFSASRFWEECVQFRCTVVQYIGEICRYLLAQPYRPAERQHCVRLAFGNGIRQQIWTEFQERFGVCQIGEFYGATESNANIVNTENRVGAVGFTTRILPWLHPVALIKMDHETDEPVRNSKGLCIRCKPGEVGEMIGKIDSNPTRYFDGYANKQATNKKVLRDVFSKGDCAFRTGDLLVMDELGYFYFRDRLGETYRWRGENVSTTEVEALLGQCLGGLHDCVVYGVEVPNCEGKAGMACIADRDNTVDLEKLGKDLANTLPAYARPVFIRLTKHIESTGTFKLKKVDLVKDGFCPQVDPSDRFFYLDTRKAAYVPLDSNTYEAIIKCSIRF